MKINVIHIFKYGEIQIISSEFNFKAPCSELKSLQAFISYVNDNKPVGMNEFNFHAINIYPDKKIDCVCKGDNSNFSISAEKIDPNFLNPLIQELLDLRAEKEKVMPITIKKK